jgi:hypothetical protein
MMFHKAAEKARPREKKPIGGGGEWEWMEIVEK